MKRTPLYQNLRLTFLRSPNPNDELLKELTSLLEALPIEVSLGGLKFARRRWLKQQYSRGKLGGRPNKVKRETSFLTQVEAQERLEWKNWKSWIRFYREEGYSKDTISHIKKELQRIASSSSNGTMG